MLIVETEPDPEHVRLLEDRLYEFNVQATGIADGQWLTILLRDAEGAVIGGAHGWSWGDTCYLRYLFVPANLRGKGQGSALLQAFETEGRARGCTQMVLETHSFQAPEFYRAHGFAVAGTVEDYPRGHRSLTMVKRFA